jgi:hypothetical protein
VNDRLDKVPVSSQSSGPHMVGIMMIYFSDFAKRKFCSPYGRDGEFHFCTLRALRNLHRTGKRCLQHKSPVGRLEPLQIAQQNR